MKRATACLRALLFSALVATSLLSSLAWAQSSTIEVTECGQVLDQAGATYVLTQDLTGCTGNGLIIGADNVTLDGQGSLAASGGLGTYTLIEDSFGASGSVTITYEFCEIPEPATMGILSLGGLVMFYFRKK